MGHEGQFTIRTYGKPQIKPASTCSSANSSKDSPTLSDVKQPSCCPTYLAIYAYVSYKTGERNVAKRIVGVLSPICHSFRPASRAKPSTFPISKKLFMLLLNIR